LKNRENCGQKETEKVESRGCAGAGVYKGSDGNVYDGEYKDGNKHGRGIGGGGGRRSVCAGVWRGRRDRSYESVAAAMFGFGRADPSLLPSRAVEPGPGCECGPLRRFRPGEWAAARRVCCPCIAYMDCMDAQEHGVI
jgi:hypothetical protein